MDHQFQPRQVDAARGDIGGDADPRPPVPQRLKRMGPFLLAQFTRQRHDLKTPVAHPGQQVADIRPRLAKDDGGARLVIAQQVEDRMFPVAHRDAERAVFDIDVLARLAGGLDPQRILLEILRKFRDRLGDGGREHQRAPVFGGRLQDEFQILAEAEVKHFVGLVQHRSAQARQVQPATFDMVAQPARSAHDDMRAAFQRPAFGAVVHAAHAGGDLRPRFAIKPGQFARHLKRQFPRRRDHQRQGRGHIQEPARPQQDFGRHRKPEGHRLARARLRGHQNIPPRDFGGKNSLLHRGQVGIALGCQRRGQRRGNIVFGHFNRQERGCIHPMSGAHSPPRPGHQRPPRPGTSEPKPPTYP